MPHMRELNLRDNRLTDTALLPLIGAIRQRPDLISLDLSENKADTAAARELGCLFSNPALKLQRFALAAADVDDGECARFVDCLKVNRSLTHLDLSRNLIGQQESRNCVNPNFYTGKSLTLLYAMYTTSASYIKLLHW